MRALFFLLKRYDDALPVNIGGGQEVSIEVLAQTIARVVGFQGRIVYDASKLDGTPRKLLYSGLAFDLGWKPKIPLEDGLRDAYFWLQCARPELIEAAA
jgi:GDP-L-fucose synthase